MSILQIRNASIVMMAKRPSMTAPNVTENYNFHKI